MNEHDDATEIIQPIGHPVEANCPRIPTMAMLDDWEIEEFMNQEPLKQKEIYATFGH